MKFIDDSLDIGVPEFCVTGVAMVERISRNQIRVPYFARRRGESLVVCHTVWDIEAWRKTCEMIGRACEQIVVEPPHSDAGDHPARHAH
jgi:hypothetical protein